MRRIEGVPRGIIEGDVQQRQQGRQEWLQCSVQRQELAGHAFADLPLVVTLLDPAIRLQQLDDRQVRRGLPVGDRAAFEHQPAMGTVRPRELPDEPRFPHAGLAHDGDCLPVSRGGALQHLRELVQLNLASDEAGQASRGAGLKPGPCRHAPGQFVDRGRGLEPLHGNRPERSDLDIAFSQLEGFAGDQHGSGLRHLLHPGGEMGRQPDGGVIHVQITADGPHDYLARIEPHADLHGRAAPALDLVHVDVDPPLHSQRGIARAYGVILVGKWRTEQRHDPVAHHLVHGAFVAVHRFHHVFENRVEELARLLGVTVGQQLHRPL